MAYGGASATFSINCVKTTSCHVVHRFHITRKIRKCLHRSSRTCLPAETRDFRATIMASGDLTTFDSIYSHLTATYGFPLLPVASPNAHDKSLSHPISDLNVHPTLEAILHILNSDLPSAHFLCRHMQNEPAWEGMYIHGLLHRVEGDYENTKLWYAQVAESECFENVWPSKEGQEGLESAKEFVDGVKALRDQGKSADQRRSEQLQEESKREFEALVDWCRRRYGTEGMANGEEAWVETSEAHREMAAKMIVGGEGWRKF